jgi:hypothetical protein
VIAYQTAFGVNAAVQLVALGWFVAPWVCSQIGHVKKAAGRRGATNDGLVKANARELVATVFVVRWVPAVVNDSSVERSLAGY